jgi:tetratricopeptide (TPR) repeat protein
VISSATLLLLFVAGIALLQLIPLWPSLLKILTPQGHYFHLIEGSGARPLTMSVPDTLYSTMRIAVLIFFSIIIAKTVYLGKKLWKQTVIDTIIFLSTAVIFISAALRIVNAKSWLYGNLRSPGFLLEPILINPNHAAAFFGISALLALTSIYSTDFGRKKIFYGSLFFLHSIAVAATLSRGGILAFAVSLIFFIFMKKAGSYEKEGAKFYFSIIFFLLAAGVVFHTGYALLEKEFDFKREGYFSKIEEIKTVREYAADFIITGSGMGSFSKVYPHYQDDPERRFTELENEPLQFILENGIFAAFAVFFILVWLIVKGKRDSKRNSGLISVLIFVLMHNTVDFNLHNFSTLFPVIAVLVLVVEPVELTGFKRMFLLSASIAVILLIFLTLSTEKGRKMAGYSENYSYGELIYNYPADYSVPMYKAIEKLNSSATAEMSSAGQYTSAAMSKAPRYYFTHYIAGNYMLRLGSVEQALVFYRKSVELSSDKYPVILRKIYNDLKAAGLSGKITEVISINDSNIIELERFLFETSKTDKVSLEYIHSNEDLFFLSAIKSYIDKKDHDAADRLILRIESSRKEISKESKGMILMYKGMILESRKEHRAAFEHYSKGAEITGSFHDHLRAAYCALNLDKTAVDKAETGVKSALLKSSGNIAHYYKWLSRREFMDDSFADGLKYLEKAADMSNNPGWRFELANVYSRRGMYYVSVKHLLKIKKEHPAFITDSINRRIEEEKKKLSDKEQKNFKELMLGN